MRALSRASLVAISVASVLTAALFGAPGAAVSAGVRWKHLTEGDFSVYFVDGDENAARKLVGWANEARAIAGRVLRVSSLPGARIYLHPRSDWKYSPYSAHADVEARAVHFPAPSEAPRDINDTWYFKNLIHEYVHVAHGWILGRKWWGYRETPRWFREGLAEYIAVMESTPEVRAAYRRYYEQMRRAVALGDTSFLFKDDIYTWGVWFAIFLTDQFGEDALARIVHSRAPWFSRALEEVTGLDALGLERRWMEWLPQYIERVEWPVAQR